MNPSDTCIHKKINLSLFFNGEIPRNTKTYVTQVELNLERRDIKWGLKKMLTTLGQSHRAIVFLHLPLFGLSVADLLMRLKLL